MRKGRYNVDFHDKKNIEYDYNWNFEFYEKIITNNDVVDFKKGVSHV